MQTIGNFDDWKEISSETEFPIAGERTRAISLDLNAPRAVALYVVDNGGEINFLARVQGRDRVRFVARGKASLRIDPIEGDTLYIHSRSGQPIHLAASEKEIWSKYHERRAYDPAVELAKYIASQNMMAMDKKLEEMRSLANALNNAAADIGGNGAGGEQSAESGAGADAEGAGNEADASQSQ